MIQDRFVICKEGFSRVHIWLRCVLTDGHLDFPALKQADPHHN